MNRLFAYWTLVATIVNACCATSLAQASGSVPNSERSVLI
jgi:hypothetical protein